MSMYDVETNVSDTLSGLNLEFPVRLKLRKEIMKMLIDATAKRDRKIGMTIRERKYLDTIIAPLHPDETIFSEDELEETRSMVLNHLATAFPLDMPKLTKLSNKKLYKYCNKVIGEL